MRPAIHLREVGVRFRVPRRRHTRGRGGRAPRLLGGKRWTLWGIRDVTLEVAQGEVVGLIGPNGAGKTTLLRTAAGIYLPSEGRVDVRGRIAPILSLSAGLETQLSGWENVLLSAVLLGLSRERAREVAPAVAEFAGLGDFMDAPVRVYSAGMRARLGFSVAMFADPDVLLIDEILAVGDREFRERSQAKIREFMSSGRAVLVSSHDVQQVAEVSNRLVRLEEGHVVDQGDPGQVVEGYMAAGHPAAQRAPGVRR